MTKTIEEPKLVQIDLKYLCPNDPNREKVLKADGLVLPEDAPRHTTGWFTDMKNVEKKHRIFKEGREVEFTTTHMTAKWTCQKCGGEIIVDPYQ